MKNDSKSPPYEVGYKKPPSEHNFPKGHSGNLRGRPEHKELKKIRKLTKDELAEVANLIIYSSYDDLQRLLEDRQNTPALHLMVLGVVKRIIVKGDMHALQELLNRLIGKVRDDVHIVNEAIARIVVTIPSNGREAPGRITPVALPEPTTTTIDVTPDDDVDLGF